MLHVRLLSTLLFFPVFSFSSLMSCIGHARKRARGAFIEVKSGIAVANVIQHPVAYHISLRKDFDR